MTDALTGKGAALPEVKLTGKDLTLEDVFLVAKEGARVSVSPEALGRVKDGRLQVESYLSSGKPAYGINTGFGSLCDTSISSGALAQLQQNLVRSHASGVGGFFSEAVVRAAMLLRANSLCRGNSGVRPVVVETLVHMLNRGVTPLVRQKGSLGASGDLAPLAHLALVLTGEGKARFGGSSEIFDGSVAMQKAGIEPLELMAKEGLALLNGTAFMSAVAVLTYWQAVHLLEAQNAAAALSLEAFRGTPSAYSPSLLELRPHPGALASGAHLRELLKGSKVTDSAERLRIQDPYSFRCVPQVHGMALTALAHIREVLSTEINSATDNPLVIDGEVISGGNFHGQPVGAIMDYLCVAVTPLAAMSERRTNQLMNPGQSGLPAFLIKDPGLNSGFMIPQYSAASLVNEARVLSTPASVQSVPVCNDQEDHISMATAASSKAYEVVQHAIKVVAVELLSAAQALDLWVEMGNLSAPVSDMLGQGTRTVYEDVRKVAPYVAQDSVMSDLIENVANLIKKGSLTKTLRGSGFVLFEQG